jgi:serine/threonine-protein kinase
VAGGGALAYVRAAAGAEDVQEAVWISREGRVTPVDSSWTFDAIGNAGWALSPDGKRLAIRLTTEQGNQIWIKELDRGPVSRITFDSSANVRPRWLADGKTVSYQSVRTGHPSQALFTRRADGTGVEERRLTMNRAIWEAVWSRDGKWLVLRTGGVTGVSGERDAFVMQLGVDTAPRPLLTTAADEKALALSPDGRWLAYESNETGQEEVYVRPFPNVESGKWQVSVSGGRAPLWARSGRELFYLNTSNQMIAAQIPAGVQFSVAERVALFPVGPEYVSSANYTPFDVHPDGRRFLMVRRRQLRQGQDVAPLIIVENWLEELKAKIRH